MWIPVEERLPNEKMRVLICYRTLSGWEYGIAEYIPARSILAEDFFGPESDYLTDYDEENGAEWVPEGFYRKNEILEELETVDELDLHWMPLPEPPFPYD